MRRTEPRIPSEHVLLLGGADHSPVTKSADCVSLNCFMCDGPPPNKHGKQDAFFNIWTRAFMAEGRDRKLVRTAFLARESAVHSISSAQRRARLTPRVPLPPRLCPWFVVVCRVGLGYIHISVFTPHAICKGSGTIELKRADLATAVAPI